MKLVLSHLQAAVLPKVEVYPTSGGEPVPGGVAIVDTGAEFSQIPTRLIGTVGRPLETEVRQRYAQSDKNVIGIRLDFLYSVAFRICDVDITTDTAIENIKEPYVRLGLDVLQKTNLSVSWLRNKENLLEVRK